MCARRLGDFNIGNIDKAKAPIRGFTVQGRGGASVTRQGTAPSLTAYITWGLGMAWVSGRWTGRVGCRVLGYIVRTPLG